MIVTGDTTKNLENALGHPLIQESLKRIKEDEDREILAHNYNILKKNHLKRYLNDQCLRLAQGNSGLFVSGNISVYYDARGRIEGFGEINSRMQGYNQGKLKIFAHSGGCSILRFEAEGEISERARRLIGSSFNEFNNKNCH